MTTAEAQVGVDFQAMGVAFIMEGLVTLPGTGGIGGMSFLNGKLGGFCTAFPASAFSGGLSGGYESPMITEKEVVGVIVPG